MIKGSKMFKASRKKMSISRKGMVPWNKGKKTGQIPWNKGTKGIMKAWNKGKKSSPEHIANVKKNHSHFKYWLGKKRPEMSGEKNWNWRGGEVERRRGHKWQLIRKQVLIRFEFKCAHCGKIAKLDVHHIIPYREVQEHKLENLIPLCKSCHLKEEGRNRK